MPPPPQKQGETELKNYPGEVTHHFDCHIITFVLLLGGLNQHGNCEKYWWHIWAPMKIKSICDPMHLLSRPSYCETCTIDILRFMHRWCHYGCHIMTFGFLFMGWGRVKAEGEWGWKRVRLREWGWESEAERMRLCEWGGWESEAERVRLRESGCESKAEKAMLWEWGWQTEADRVRLREWGWENEAARVRLRERGCETTPMSHNNLCIRTTELNWTEMNW